MRNYQSGEGAFTAPRILRRLARGGLGGVELAARYDYVDLTAVRTPRAGVYSGVTLGANWYPFAGLRFMANYTRGENDNPMEAFDADVNTLQFRAQIDF